MSPRTFRELLLGGEGGEELAAPSGGEPASNGPVVHANTLLVPEHASPPRSPERLAVLVPLVERVLLEMLSPGGRLGPRARGAAFSPYDIPRQRFAYLQRLARDQDQRRRRRWRGRPRTAAHALAPRRHGSPRGFLLR